MEVAVEALGLRGRGCGHDLALGHRVIGLGRLGGRGQVLGGGVLGDVAAAASAVGEP
ncbi:hypothetical protein RF638_15625 [Kocuria sp. CPCC 205235]|uniref:hypothetical protein n=1 Tax=Kocuria sp. CPCC 205235 TaxID=3073549 RepID=UPI0034D46954